MGCGCGGNKARGARRAVRNVVHPSGQVTSANINSKAMLSDAEKIIQERRIVENKRRENLLKALKRP